MPSETEPVISDAAKDLAERAMDYSEENPLYVIAIGAITNVSSALLMNPEIKTGLYLSGWEGMPFTGLTTGNSICFRMSPEQELYLDAVFLWFSFHVWGLYLPLPQADRNWNTIFAVRQAL